MGRNLQTEALVDGLLRIIAGGGVLLTGMVTPNSLTFLDKPLRGFFKELDEAASERELLRLVNYMRRQGLVSNKSEDYEHGLLITKAGRRRLLKHDFTKLKISQPPFWDQQWRMVFFDIPETHKRGRQALTMKLKALGFQQLQRSVWIHPFPARQEIEKICEVFEVTKYVSYIETTSIDHAELLRERFSSVLRGIPTRARPYH